MLTHFTAHLSELPAMLSRVREEILRACFQPKIAKQVEIAVEEVLVNIIKHAYDDGGPIDITCQVSPGQRIKIIITDEGEAFNPLEVKSQIDLTAALHEREEGGLGIRLIREFIDEIQYKREDDKNILALIKHR